ncbi:flagellar export protein FliJ [Marinomonas sp. C2222]|uniref:Flagellar FliJ protein n=1 Tax=Marinomonas sargassi TaxID=2984494 RepID=A0ABT2YND2_9GAMM|nr:flagellar export protein FliJ [Marinomonas sargassi]MCV2401393.1 flagellar export protein FliJ [Marinomonas sargassi]
MKKSLRIQTLVDLAKRKEDAAAQKFAQDKALVEASVSKLQELKEYSEQYESERNLLGLSPYLTTNYQHFVDRVKQAIVQQEAAVVRAEQQAGMSMRLWLQERSKTQSMDWLKEKNHKAEQLIESKQEQVGSDEFAMRRFWDTSH